MLKKVYIWNDLYLIKRKIDRTFVNEKLKELEANMNGKIEVLNGIEKNFIKYVNKLSNIVTIGSRPCMFIKNKKVYKIFSKRIIPEDGFARDCVVDIDERIKYLDEINIIEDIIVTGTTMNKIIEKLLEQNKDQTINIYFLIGYENAINELKEKHKNINVSCYKVIAEKSVQESTCIFLSDLLYEKIGNRTYMEHIQKNNVFEDYTAVFVKYIKEIMDKNKPTAAIVTITIGINYGNRLQNYALQEILRKLNVEATTLNNVYQEKEIKNKIKRSLTLFKKKLKYMEELKRFKEFDKANINIKYKIKSYKVNKKLKNMFDFYICGSDQIWNPYFSGNTGVNYLSFSNYNKNIAYAPSFGTSTVPKEKIPEIEKNLQNIKYLSCREIERSKYYKKNIK